MSWTSRWAWIGALALLACEAQEAADADAGACNGPSVWFGDADGDGQGDPLEVFAGCPPPAGYVDNSNDPDPACAGGVTDACGVCGGPGPRLWYRDADHDGLGDLIDGTVECAAPAGFVDNADDPEPACATNDTDPCGICAGAGGPMGYRDQDEDGLGDPEQAMVLCGPEPGFVLNDDDPEPECATNDTDDCGVCAGEGIRRYFADQDEDGRGDPEVWIDACARPLRFVESDDDPDPRCATDDTDDCGVCGGGGASKDCVGVCFGEARLDGCGRCAGGTTGRVPFVDDDNQNGVPDACDQCPATPTARAIIQWTDVPAFGPEGASGPYSFQVILYENGDFVFVYADIEPFEATPTVGHQGLAGHGAVSLGVDSDYAREHPVVFFHADDDGRVEVDYTLTADWLDVRAAGEALPFADANGEVEVPLDFQFPYDGARYDRVRVSANGVITLAGAAPGPQNGPMGDPALGAFLAPFWDDLDPASSGSVFVWQQPADCERDCAGQFGGVAVVDDCGVCVGGTSRADPHAHR
ncbi:MAG: hypothetical protein KC620_04310, partial [Myxococcales bacterium]|nr:hypothetical protein [Myxococcales bacterium]